MKRRIALALTALCGALAVLFSAPATASAHPLGNFTVNRYAGIELAGSEIYVRYALDLAEIPTYQVGDEVRQPGYAGRLARELVLTLDGRRIPLRVVESRATARPGAGGLETLRLDVVYRGRGAGTELAFEDMSFPGRIGWREVTVTARDGARVVDSEAAATSASDLLREYPSDQLSSPLDVSSASATIVLGSAAAAAPSIVESAPEEHAPGGFEALVNQGDLSVRSPPSLTAHRRLLGRGSCTHAGTREGDGRRVPRRDEGDAETCIPARRHGDDRSHVGSLRAGLRTLGLSAFIVPEQLYPWLTLVSGVLVVSWARPFCGNGSARAATTITTITITSTVTSTSTSTGTTTGTSTTTP